MKKIFFLLFVLIQTFTFSQRKTRADRYFEKGDYINAALNYEKELARYSHTKKITQNIAESYYNTYQFIKARYYLTKLFKGRFLNKDKTYDNTYNFKMYHVLSALGNHTDAVDYLIKYNENFGKKLNKKETIENIEAFKLKKANYTTKKSMFNSINNDFGATVNNDSIYFVSDRVIKTFNKNDNWTHKPYLEIYKAAIINGKVNSLTIEPLPKEINSKLHEGNFCFANNGTILYVSRSNISQNKKTFDKKRTNNIQLFKSEKINGRWTPLKKLSFCEDGYSYEHPTMSLDEKTLYFSSNIKGGYGSFDIYSIQIEGNYENYSSLKNLGSVINTKNREQFPFISKKGNLFFASNGHLGLGMLDNFVSEYSNGKFSKPVNLGTPINSKYDDFNIIYSDDINGYFSSNRTTLNDNIYSFSQMGDIFRREYITIFEVRDAKTKEFIPNVEVTLTNKKGKEIYNNILSEKSRFTINLIPDSYVFSAVLDTTYFTNSKQVQTLDKQYQKHILFLSKKPKKEIIIVHKDTTKRAVTNLIIAGKTTIRKKSSSVLISPKKRTVPIAITEKDKRRNALLLDTKGPEVFLTENNELYFKIPPIYFEFDKWTITKESKKSLDDLAQKLERYPRIHIIISAHTDNIGSTEYNQTLSERRAEATRNYIALEGYINARRLKFEGFGESVPLIDCKEKCKDEERQLNRRSEFKIIQY